MFWFLFACAVKVSPLLPPKIDVDPYRQGIDWDSVEEEAAQLLQSYIQVDTVNPPGNELQGALFLEEILTERFKHN